MSQASEQIARQYANANVNKKNWGDLLFNVKVYGAAGDYNGTTGTDDTTAFRAAIAAAKAVKGIVYIPPGNYLITGELTVDYSFRMVGSGQENTFISCSGTFTLLDFTGEVIELENMTFRQVGGTVRCVHAVRSCGGVYAGVYLKATKCNFDYFSGDAIYAEDVIDSQFFQCRGYGPYSDTTPGTTTTRTSSWLRITYNAAFNTTIAIQYCYISSYKHGFYGINCASVNFIQSIFEKNWIGIYGTKVPTGPYGGPALFWTVEGCYFEANLHPTHGGGYFDDITTPANYVNAVYVRGNNYLYDASQDNLVGSGLRKEVLTSMIGNMRLRGYTTATRPNPADGYEMVLDTTLRKIIWYDFNTSQWRDAMGTVV